MTPAQIAADVSARYGIPVCPSVVTILPYRVAVEPDCFYDPKSGHLVAKEKGRETMRKQISAQVKAARAIGQRKGREVVAEKKRQRVAELQAFAAKGVTIYQLAERMGCKPSTAERYARDNKIPLVGKLSVRRDAEAAA